MKARGGIRHCRGPARCLRLARPKCGVRPPSLTWPENIRLGGLMLQWD